MATNNEIDLQRVAIMIYRFVKQNRVVLSAFFLLGLILGIIKSDFKPSYVTTMRVKSFMRLPYISLVEVANKQIQFGQYDIISNKFMTIPDSVKKISTIEVVPIFSGQPDGKKKELVEFLLVVSVKNDSIYSDNIFQWLENMAMTDVFTKERYNLEMQKMSLLIDKYDAELKILDSVQFGKTEVKSGQIVLENNTTILQQKLELYKSRIVLKDSQLLTKPLILMNTMTEKKIINKKLYPLVIYPFLLFFLSVISLVFFNLIRSIKQSAESTK